MKILEIFKDWDDIIEEKANSVIFAERTPADVMYVILQGDIELTLHGESLGMESTGGIIGEMAMINSTLRSATATSLSKVKLARLDRDQFRHMVAENSEFALHVMAVLANRLRVVNEFVTSQFSR
jgi:CRP-like cAMP-binding protein